MAFYSEYKYTAQAQHVLFFNFKLLKSSKQIKLYPSRLRSPQVSLCYLDHKLIIIVRMEVKESKTIQADLFSPWNDEHEQEIYQLQTAAKQINQATKRQSFIKKKKTKLKLDTQKQPSIEDVAKKTLLDLDRNDKEHNIAYLKNYLIQKTRSPLEKDIFNPQELKLPMIKKDKPYFSKQIERKKIQNSNSFVVPNKIKPDNQEQEIFKKYGQHRKSPSNAERSISHGQAHVSSKRSIKNLKHKYETVDVSRQRSEFQPELKNLNLKGKKYSYEIRYREKSKEDISYLPTQPNITPHYVLFGGSKEDIFKKIYQQLQHRFK